MAAIESAVAVVLVLSESANKSTYVESEIERAFAKRRHIFPFRIQEVTPVPGLEFCIARIHWIEAWTPPRDAPLQTLAEAVRAVVEPAPLEVPKPPEPVPKVVPDPMAPVGTVFRDPFGDGRFGSEMVVLPAGMGSLDSDTEAYPDEKPQHLVRIGDRFAVGRYPVTFDEWDACVADGGVDYRPCDEGWGRGLRPVIKVSWKDAKSYLAWLSRKTGRLYRLLSEAEWEYAARAGTTTRRWWGDGITPKNANYFESKIGKTAEVGSYRENSFKLHDMLGNVYEWIDDCYENSYSNALGDESAR